MKFMSFKTGLLCLLLSLSFITVSCTPEEYFPVEKLVEGADDYCSQAKDVNSCQQLNSFCQPAFEDLEIDTEEPVFNACIANPDAWSSNDDDASDVADGASDPAVDPAIDPAVDPATDPSVDPTEDLASDSQIKEAFKTKCQDLEPKFLLVINEVKKNKVIKTTSKVKVCHQTGNGSSHTIVIACPALKAHDKHGDYLGSCKY